MVVERAFGILKVRFRVLDADPFWSFKTEVDVVLACCVIHNFLRGKSSHEKYLNQKIDMYEEIAIVAGKDMARGDFFKSFADIELSNESGQGQPTSMTENGPSKSDSATSSVPRQHHKRTRGEDDTCDLQQISNQLEEVVSALKKFSINQLDVEKLYEEIMKMDDFEEAVCDAAFDHSVE
uniref:DDE Tnp4 domain-containing protein n=1 Tax=Chenopodium quinoa TaxID=63459 RepID=A0A803MAZ6_CHEQI